MFKFATATILASYAQSISLTLESEAESSLATEANCPDCLTLDEWKAKITDLADAINYLNTGKLADNEVLLKPIFAFY